MKKSAFIISALSATLGTMAQSRPNIILIVADDMGYSDLGSYGSEISTPNLDRLANEGVRFQEFYNNSISAPTRASLITGQYQHKAGVGYFSNNLGLPNYQGYINKESLTLAEVLHNEGYNTFHAGKWHLSGRENGTLVSEPLDRGFNQSYQLPSNGFGYFKNEGYATNLIGDNAVNFIASTESSNKPFFLYLAFTAPHWPLHALEEDIAKYRGKYDIGWDSLRIRRFERQKALGIVDNSYQLSKKDNDIYEWDRLSYDQRHLWSKKMEVYAAMVDRLDHNVGRVLEQLEKSGKADNTLIVFLSDNGAPAEDLIKWHGGASRNSGPVGTSGSNESQSKNWSYASNTPFRAFKDYLYEGGINTPFIAWYPNKIGKGRIVKGTGHIIDLAPTLYQIAKTNYPKKYKSIKTSPLPGVSLLPVLYGETDTVLRSAPLCWERAGNRAIRFGKWKLTSHYPSHAWELYDLSTDHGESQNVASKHHEVVSQLSTLYFKWAEENGVVEFSEIEDREPKMMKDFRKSKTQDVPASFGTFGRR